MTSLTSPTNYKGVPMIVRSLKTYWPYWVTLKIITIFCFSVFRNDFTALDITHQILKTLWISCMSRNLVLGGLYSGNMVWVGFLWRNVFFLNFWLQCVFFSSNVCKQNFFPDNTKYTCELRNFVKTFILVSTCKKNIANMSFRSVLFNLFKAMKPLTQF